MERQRTFATLVVAAVAGILAGPATAQEPRSRDALIAGAVQPLPQDLRAGATVLGRSEASGGLVTLRRGDGDMICLADDPAVADTWHVACYHESLSPFMERGRELRAQGESDAAVDSIRAAEAEAGTLSMPDQGAALYSLTGPPSSFDPETGTVSPEARPLFVLYVPWATPGSTGLSPQPRAGEPWLMNPGAPGAHIMLTPP